LFHKGELMLNIPINTLLIGSKWLVVFNLGEYETRHEPVDLNALGVANELRYRTRVPTPVWGRCVLRSLSQTSDTTMVQHMHLEVITPARFKVAGTLQVGGVPLVKSVWLYDAAGHDRTRCTFEARLMNPAHVKMLTSIKAKMKETMIENQRSQIPHIAALLTMILYCVALATRGHQRRD
jgi:hypothetical protein